MAREAPPPSESTAGRGLAAIAANPVTGTTVPLLAMFAWMFNLISSGNDKIDDVKTQVTAVSATVAANSKTLESRIGEVTALSATVVELKFEVAGLKRDIEADEKATASLEARISAMEAKQ